MNTAKSARKYLAWLSRHRYKILGVVLVILILFNLDNLRNLIWELSFRPEYVLLPILTNLQDILTLTLSILIEALPFLLLGVLASVAIQFFVPAKVFNKIIPKNRFARRMVMTFAGVLLPVCECGNVPVARSLMQRGTSPGDAITFLLSAPILNPIVLVVTWQAFGSRPEIFFSRFIGAFLVANATAFIVTRLLHKDKMLTPDFAHTCKANHEHRRSITLPNLMRYMVGELWPLIQMLCLGAVIAAATQIFIPREVLTGVGSDPVLSVLAMIILGFIISICSSVDAFFALAYARTFTAGSLAAFMITGPMVDIKMLALLKTTFTARAIALICVVVLSLTLSFGIFLNYLLAVIK